MPGCGWGDCRAVPLALAGYRWPAGVVVPAGGRGAGVGALCPASD
ncbi:MAG: hypothetical protein KDE29_13605 [Anaerolineales bacterium]|nr:hypothetical protein [Anaerolineales bacterium]